MGQSICVLGMHRSGTSCLTGIMQRFGVDLGEVFEHNPFNKKGNREHPRIMALNEALLAINGGAWDRPTEVVVWSKEQIIERTEVLNDISNYGGNYWGFKDPRFLFTYPFWLEAISPLYIATFRHPYRVALSLKQRSNMPIDAGMALWYAYNTKLVRFLQENEVPLVCFDLDPRQYLKEVTKKLISLGLPAAHKEQAKGFFESSLRVQSQQSIDDCHLHPSIQKLYEVLLDYHVSQFS